MPRQYQAGEAMPFVVHGPKAEYVPAALIAAVQAQGTVAANSSWTSPAFTTDGYYDVVAGLTLSQSGSVTLLRFIDDNASVALDAGQTQALTAATAGVLVVQDGKPFATYQIKITNSGGTAAAISNFAALTSAH
jgi:hypothetical protein